MHARCRRGGRRRRFRRGLRLVRQRPVVGERGQPGEAGALGLARDGACSGRVQARPFARSEGVCGFAHRIVAERPAARRRVHDPGGDSRSQVSRDRGGRGAAHGGEPSRFNIAPEHGRGADRRPRGRGELFQPRADGEFECERDAGNADGIGVVADVPAAVTLDDSIAIRKRDEDLFEEERVAAATSAEHGRQRGGDGAVQRVGGELGDIHNIERAHFHVCQRAHPVELGQRRGGSGAPPAERLFAQPEEQEDRGVRDRAGEVEQRIPRHGRGPLHVIQREHQRRLTRATLHEVAERVHEAETVGLRAEGRKW